MTTEMEREEFGAAMARLRQRSGLTLNEISDQLKSRGIHKTDRALSAWQRGRSAPNERAVVVALDEILDGDGELVSALNLVGGDTVYDRLDALQAQVDELSREVRRRRR